ncbi:MAG TPA: hypothetical protein VMF88_05325 [Bacteroidota bacterium]|nr:hypothetical protein [Bacteroidota bacterium]
MLTADATENSSWSYWNAWNRNLAVSGIKTTALCGDSGWSKKNGIVNPSDPSKEEEEEDIKPET